MRFVALLIVFGLQQPCGASTFESFEQPRVLLGLAQLPFYSFYLGAPDVNGVAYLPNFSTRLGLRFAWKGYGTALTLALPIPDEEIERRGNSDQAAFILRHHSRQFSYDLYHQRYRGFYIASPLTELRSDKPFLYPQLPEAVVTNSGFNFYYVLNPENYSLAAAFDMTEFQLSAGGSWLIKPFYNHLEMSLGSKFVLGSDPEGRQEAPQLHSGTFDTGGIAGGYGYSLTSDRYFLAGQGTVGIGTQYQQLARLSGNDLKRLSLAVKINFSLAAGYNGPVWLYGLRAFVDSLSSRIGETQIASSLVMGEAFAGARF